MDRTGLTRVNFLDRLRRGWLTRALCGAGLFAAFGHAPAVFAADYQGEKVADFVREMTQDYGFASEQVIEVLAQAEEILPAILGYTAWVYWIFRGKIDEDSGYHH